MKVQLRPELEQFVDQQVKSGHFASPTEVLEAGLARLMLDPAPELDTQDVEEIRASLDEMRRGDTVDWRQHSAQLRKKYGGA